MPGDWFELNFFAPNGYHVFLCNLLFLKNSTSKIKQDKRSLASISKHIPSGKHTLQARVSCNGPSLIGFSENFEKDWCNVSHIWAEKVFWQLV